jgi:hypothetical protein
MILRRARARSASKLDLARSAIQRDDTLEVIALGARWSQAGESNPVGLIGTLPSPGTAGHACDA